MCGLFGWSINPDMVDKVDLHTMATMLAYFAQRRGNDSWGVARRESVTAEPEIIKELGSISKTCRVPRILAPTVLGHTRAATVGAVSQRNAHPFQVKNIIGAHNGHVSNWSEMNNKYSRQCQVDSEHLFHHIAEGKDTEELSGSGTITFFDTEQPGSIFFGRGQYSDLEIFSMGPSEHPWGTLWSSIGMWGEDALEMAGVTEYDQWTTHLSTAYELNDQLLYEIGTFTLRTNYTQYQGIAQHSRCHSYQGQVPHKIWDSDNNDYVECKTMDEYWERLRNNRIKAGTLPKDDVEHLPPSLKKILKSEYWSQKTGKRTKLLKRLSNVMGVTVGDTWLKTTRITLKALSNTRQSTNTSAINAAAFGDSKQEHHDPSAAT